MGCILRVAQAMREAPAVAPYRLNPTSTRV